VNNGRFFRLMVFVATSVVFRFGGSGGGASSGVTSWPQERAISSVGSKLSPDSTSVSVVTWFSELDDGSSLSTCLDLRQASSGCVGDSSRPRFLGTLFFFLPPDVALEDAEGLGFLLGTFDFS